MKLFGICFAFAAAAPFEAVAPPGPCERACLKDAAGAIQKIGWIFIKDMKNYSETNT